jgi:hypothetical protein
VPSGDVEQLLRGLRLIVAKLMHQGSAVHFRPERQNDIDVTDLGKLVTLPGEPLDVIP